MINNLGNNRVFINDHDVIEIAVVGDQTIESVDIMGIHIKRLRSKQRSHDKPVLLLDNLVQIGKVPPEARKRVVELAKTIPYDKFAMYGKSTLLRLGANLMIQAIGKRETVRFFEDYDQAIAWLKGK